LARRARYNTGGKWFKGSTHTHTVRSDGGLTYRQMMSLYARAGFDFLFITDHNFTADIEREPNPPLLALNGVEVDGNYDGANYHVLGLGVSKPVDPAWSIEKKLRFLKREGAIRVLAHPAWSGVKVPGALKWNFDGVEAFNAVCHWLNGKSLGLYHWDCMLEKNPNTLGFCGDDAHHLRGQTGRWNIGWVMVNAPELTKRNVLGAIRRGNFYCTQGPAFRRIETTCTRVRVKTSGVKEIRLVGPKHIGDRVSAPGRGRPLTEAAFDISGKHCYLRMDIEDFHGRRAWSNTLFVE